MEKLAFTRANLSGVRVIMVIMHVLVGALLSQATMGWILVLKCLLSGARGHLWLRPIMPGIKCHRFPMTRLPWCLPCTKMPPGVTIGARVHTVSGHEEDLQWTGKW
jgi:hypothetical protein